MSVSDREISSFGNRVGGVDDDHNDGDDDDDDVDGGVHRKKQRGTRRYGLGGFSCSASLGKKAKSFFVLSPLKKKLSKKKQTHVKAKASSSGSGNVGDVKGCFFCVTQRSSNGGSVSPSGSQTSDPNNPNFTYDMLRVLIERNDFCCKECNTHLDSEDV